MEGVFYRRQGLFQEHWPVMIILWLLFFERLLMLSHLGYGYTLGSDDLSYLKAGITYANTGAITMHGVISAQIMPGLPVLISLFVKLFGEGDALWLFLKVFWATLGVLAALFTYLASREIVPRWAAVAVTLLYLTPDFAWQDNLILTETPYMFLITLYLWGLFRLGKYGNWGDFVVVLVSAFCAYMLKAQASIFLFFPIPYLFVKKFPTGRIYLQTFVTFLLIAAFTIPWSIRNYTHFGEFIPATYGIGNPLLLGTYQGVGYPTDEEAFDEDALIAKEREKYSRFLKDGEDFSPKHWRFFYLRLDEAKAKARMDYWWKHDRASMLKSYLYLKPKFMLFKTFYWDEVIPKTRAAIENLRHVDFALAMLAIPLSLVLRRFRAEAFFLVLAYWIQIYMYAYAYVFDRYAQTLLPFRYIASAISLTCLWLLFKKLKGKLQTLNNRRAAKRTIAAYRESH